MAEPEGNAVLKTDQPSVWMRELAGHYYGLDCFATEDLGVPLEAWLALHPDGPLLVDIAQDVIADRTARPTMEAVLDDDGFDSAEAIGERVYQAVANEWAIWE